MSLTIAYMTARRKPMFDWFADSLRLECGRDYGAVRLLIIDFYAEDVGRRDQFGESRLSVQPPKPTVWQGSHRLTCQDYFCAANARNTALCHAPDGWIAFVDDLSVLMPGWLLRVREAMRRGYCVFGAYKKVKRLVVEDGIAVNFQEFPGGVDSRWARGSDNDAVPIKGSFGTYGCSMALPVDALLKINGFDERCDCVGLGSEDDMAGLMLMHNGYDLRYDRRMLTFESEERHHWEVPLKRVIETGYGDRDASWALLNDVRGGRKRAPNEHLGPGGIAELRQRILAGEPFPKPAGPIVNWYSGKPTDAY